MENKYISVSALNRYIQYKFDTDVHLQLVYLKAEISNLRLSKGILYFVLKDEESEIDGIMFQNVHTRLDFKPIDGMTVLVTGKVSVYQKRGRYSITVSQLEEAGLGDAYLNFLRLKEQLAKEGLFDDQYKKPIPAMSEAIGVITSATGDAVRDIISTVEKRFPLAKIYLYPALVQGKDAPLDLIRALRQANEDKIVDVLIIGRGGGSIEDLSCFNDEALARTIFHSSIPIVSAVGHENDYTICDFVADYRAPTPTGAAVKVTKDKTDIQEDIIRQQNTLKHAIRRKLIQSYNDWQAVTQSYGFAQFEKIFDQYSQSYYQLAQRLALTSPLKLIEQYQSKNQDLTLRIKSVRLDKKIEQLLFDVLHQSKRIQRITQQYIAGCYQSVQQHMDKLIILNPLHVMKKGYTVSYQDDKIVASIAQINDQKPLTVQFADGKVVSKIMEVKNEKLS